MSNLADLVAAQHTARDAFAEAFVKGAQTSLGVNIDDDDQNTADEAEQNSTDTSDE